MRHIHPKLHYSNIKGEFRKLKYLNTVHFPHTLVLTSIYKKLCKSSPPELLLTWALWSWHSDSAQDWPPSGFRSLLKFLLRCLLLFVWFCLINRWNLLMPQPWSQSQRSADHAVLHLQPIHTNQSKSNEGAQKRAGGRPSYKGSKNKKQILKKSHRMKQGLGLFFCLRTYLGDSKRYWLIPLIPLLSDLKLLLPEHVGLHFTNWDFHYWTVNLIHSLTDPTDHPSLTFGLNHCCTDYSYGVSVYHVSSNESELFFIFSVSVQYKQGLSQD